MAKGEGGVKEEEVGKWRTKERMGIMEEMRHRHVMIKEKHKTWIIKMRGSTYQNEGRGGERTKLQLKEKK